MDIVIAVARKSIKHKVIKNGINCRKGVRLRFEFEKSINRYSKTAVCNNQKAMSMLSTHPTIIKNHFIKFFRAIFQIILETIITNKLTFDIIYTKTQSYN